MLPVNHDVEIFIDVRRYERVINEKDIISATLNLFLIGSFTSAYIKEISPVAFHEVFLDRKKKQYFKLNVKIWVFPSL